MSAAVAGTVAEALGSAADAFAAAGVESPRLDAELLLEAATGAERAALATAPERGVSGAQARTFGALVRRRLQREPVAYILGRRGFRYLELRCDRRALIPRPESEMLVELGLEAAAGRGAGAGAFRVADIGTGSGAIALALAAELVGCEVVATDTSPEALALAAENVAMLGLGERVRLEAGTVPQVGRLDLLLANLPYVPAGEWPGLQPEITRFEPRSALLGGEDGLEVIRSLLGSLSPPGGGAALEVPVVGLEIGDGQGERVAALLAARGYGRTEVRADLAGLQRLVVGR